MINGSAYHMNESIVPWAIGIGCSWLTGFIAGVLFDYVAFSDYSSFAVWLNSEPFDAIVPNFLGLMAALLFLALKLIFGR